MAPNGNGATIGNPHKIKKKTQTDQVQGKKGSAPEKSGAPKTTPPPPALKKSEVKSAPKSKSPPPPKPVPSPKPVDNIPRVSVGVVYTGVQARWRMGSRFGIEARYLKDSASSDIGDVTANVMSGRLYLFSRPRHRFTFYGGGEGGSVVLKTAGTSEKINGTAFGGFAGLEYRIAKRFSWGMDVGLYEIALKKTTISIQESGTDVVINSFLNFHLF